MRIIKVGKHKVQVTHEEKILFPKTKITKGELVNFYLNIANIMVPHVKNRPIMLHRFIDPPTPRLRRACGIMVGFFQKNTPDYFPEWIKRVKIKKIEGGEIEQLVCNNPETLVYIANQLCITPHIWLSKINKINFPDPPTPPVDPELDEGRRACPLKIVDKINYPDKLVFDLDPSAPCKNKNQNNKNFTLVILAAKKVKKFLESLGLTPFVMTTGSKGLHVVVPIKRTHTFEYVKNFARDCAIILEKQNPEIFTNEMRKNKREEKIFLDIYRNAYAQTSVAPYAVRAIEGAPVATPIEWSEVNKNLDPQKYNIKNIFVRLEKKGDAWQEIGKFACSLKKSRGKLDPPTLKLRRAWGKK